MLLNLGVQICQTLPPTVRSVVERAGGGQRKPCYQTPASVVCFPGGARGLGWRPGVGSRGSLLPLSAPWSHGQLVTWEDEALKMGLMVERWGGGSSWPSCFRCRSLWKTPAQCKPPLTYVRDESAPLLCVIFVKLANLAVLFVKIHREVYRLYEHPTIQLY